jgi:hypothetical protein
MNDYTLLSVCSRIPTESYYTLEQWLTSTEGTNRLVVESVGTKYQSLADKPKYLYRLIKDRVITSRFLIFSDCYDLVFAAKPEEILDKFSEFNKPIVIGCERNCFPDDLKAEFDALAAPTTFKYLNSGMIVGYTDAIFDLLEAMKVEEIPNDYYDGEKGHWVHYNDQFEYMKAAIKYPQKIALDYQQSLCCNLHQVTIDDLDFSKERIRVKETNKYPCAFHLNGSAKTDGLREPILNHFKLL